MSTARDAAKRLLNSAAVQIGLGAAVLLAPALINGFPFWWFDTSSYHALGEGLFRNLMERLAPAPDAPAIPEPAAPAEAASPTGEGGSLTYIGGRAPLYSAAVFISHALGSYWLLAAAQAGLAAWVVSAALRALDLRGASAYAVAIAALMASTLPYFATMTMPDVFAGFAFVLLAVLGFRAERFHVAERAGLFLLLVFSLTAHSTNLALAIVMAPVALAAARLLGAPWSAVRSSAMWLAAPIVAAAAFNAAYATAVKVVMGRPPSNPPYLTARVLADGPGRVFLREACATEPARYELCRFANYPLDDPNDFLWSDEPGVGVFMLSDIATRLRLIEEERRFVIEAFLNDPLAQTVASLGNALSLAGRIDVGEELGLSGRSWANIAPHAWRDTPAAQASLVYRGEFPIRAIDAINAVALGFALGFLLWRLTRPDAAAAYAVATPSREHAAIRALGAVAAATLLLLAFNAALCGAFSGPFPRYQTRILWLIPLLAAAVYLRLGLKPGSVRSPTAA